MSGFIWVAYGGALGAVCRYAISLIPVKAAFPILTLVTNLIGAVLIGFIVGIVSSKQDVSANSVLFWKTGVCGGFTTFSAFSLEAFTLFENRAYVSGGIYCFECFGMYCRCLYREKTGDAAWMRRI